MAARPVALVTGAAHRVGRAIAVHLAASGYDIAVHYRSSRSDADSAAEACRAQGARAEAFAANLEQPDAPEALVKAVLAAFGRVDALVNSAASMAITPLETVTATEWDEIFAVN